MDISQSTSTEYINKEKEEASPKAENQKRIALSGAARKRLRRHLANGVPLEEAKRLAQKPFDFRMAVPNKSGVANKRGRSSNPTPEEAWAQMTMMKTAAPSAWNGVPASQLLATGALAAFAAAPAAEQARQEQSPQFGVMASNRDVSGPARMAILPADYPNTLLMTDQLNSIQSAILSRVMALRHGSVKPLFSGCTFRPGWMAITCGNAETVEWLCSEVPRLRLWKDAHIKVVPEGEAPRAAVFIGYFPLTNADMRTEEILNLIEGQNSGLRVGDWRVFHREMRQNTAVLTIALDPVSANRMKSLGHQLNFAWGTTLLKPKGSAHLKDRVVHPAFALERPTYSMAAPPDTAATMLQGGTADAQQLAAPRRILRPSLYGRITRGTGRITRATGHITRLNNGARRTPMERGPFA